MGLGLPMEVDVSMIVGYVMKFNYVLPYNASYLTHPYTSRYDRSIHRNPSLGHEKTSNDDEPQSGMHLIGTSLILNLFHECAEFLIALQLYRIFKMLVLELNDLFYFNFH